MIKLNKIFKSNKKSESSSFCLGNFWKVKSISSDGIIYSEDFTGFMFQADGLDGSFLNANIMKKLHNEWRSNLRILPEEEMQIIFRKRVEFSKWVEDRLNLAFLSDSSYGRKILLNKLSEEVSKMSNDEPRLFSQKILVCFFTKAYLDSKDLDERRLLIKSQLSSFGFNVQTLNRKQISDAINISSQDLDSIEESEPEWPSIRIESGQIRINDDCFRALELEKLPETFTEFGMIQSISKLPYPIDISIRIKAKETGPIVSRLQRKRNLLNAKLGNKNGSLPVIESQIEQIQQVLQSLAVNSESIFEMKMVIGLRFPKRFISFQRRALADIIRSCSNMNFCELREFTLGTFDAYLECIPSFSGKNIRTFTVLGSNVIHFLPFFRPSKGDRRQIINFQTRNSTLYGLDPVDPKLANYNWLVSGTSGSGKSFFVNSLISQSVSINPNIFIIDIGGSYNKLTEFLGGKIMSLEPGKGFELTPFFIPKSPDKDEERLRRQHIKQIFLEMIRLDGQLPSIEIRNLLSEKLDELLDMDDLPQFPITSLINIISKDKSSEASRLVMLLKPWCKKNYFGRFLDNSKYDMSQERIITFDLKGLIDFEDLSRVVQLIICAILWAKIRQCNGKRYSWIVLDEVAFSLLKVQPQFVDELVSTLRKYYAGAVIIVQDLEKVTSNLAGSSILQNTHSKAILQQRGNPKNFSEVLSFNEIDQWSIESLNREKGIFSDIFLIRDNEKTIIRHIPSALEYWMATTAPEDNKKLIPWMKKSKGSFQKKLSTFATLHKGEVI